MTSTQKCPECGSAKLIIHKDKGEIICKDCGLVVEDRIIDHTQEWQEFDSDKSEKRRRTGAPASYSVDAEEPIIIKQGNSIEIVKIGEFVDTHIQNNRYNLKKEGIVEYVPLPNKIEAVAFDKENKIDFQTIGEVSRHPAKEVYEIILESGKRVKVTGNHSIFTVKNNRVVPIKVDEVTEGAFVVTPLKIPCFEQEQTLDLLDAFTTIAEEDNLNTEKYKTQRPDIAITTTSVNSNLSNDVLALYGTLGIHAHYGTEVVPEHMMMKTGQIIAKSFSTKTIIKNPDTAKRLGYLASTTKPKGKPAIETLIPAPIEYKTEWKSRNQLRISKDVAIKIAQKYNDQDLLKLATADFTYLRVKKITKCKSTNGYAYDISVPGHENFVGGIGGIFLHNTRYDQGLGTDIGQRGDLFQLEGKGMNKFFRLRKWQYRISTAIERNLKLALAELKRVASYLKLPKSVEEEAARVYTMAVQRGLVRGRSMESVVAGALYAACRRHEVPRTLDELSEASGIDKKEVGRTYRFITRELGIRILPSNPVDYIPRFASALKLSAETQSKSVEILEMAENSELTSGRGPTGIAAASLYVAALLNNEKRTQREVADIAGVTEVTIRNRYKELFNKLKLKDKLKNPKKVTA